MSGLKDRLRRLAGNGARAGTEPKAAAARQEAPPLTAAAAGADGAGTAALDPRWSAFAARLETCGCGSFIKRRRLYEADHRHGRYRLGELNERAAALAAFHGGDAVRHDELLFLDTETTGLGIGAGNVPFLIGIGFWETDGQFAVEQLFIRDPAEEAAMLEYLQDKLARHPRLVTYNGRSFDWPLVKSRFVMNRMRPPSGEPIHLDFLYPSRSLWKGTLPSCRLGHVEEERLGFRRDNDVPGSLAPPLYFQYLSDRNPDTIRPVFVHNEHDVLSLASLAVHFARALEGELDLAAMEPEETYRTGIWLDRMGRAELADEVLRGLEQSDDPAAAAYRLPLAAYCKRKGEHDRAAALWLRAIRQEEGSPHGLSIEPYIELAMHYEHRVKDLEAARQFAEEAKAIALRRAALAQRPGGRPRSGRGALALSDCGATLEANGSDRLLAELDKRLRRLQEKQARAASKKPASRNSGDTLTGAVDSACSAQAAPPANTAWRKLRGRRKSGDVAVAPEALTLF